MEKGGGEMMYTLWRWAHYPSIWVKTMVSDNLKAVQKYRNTLRRSGYATALERRGDQQ
jgi:hypothetical protein